MSGLNELLEGGIGQCRSHPVGLRETGNLNTPFGIPEKVRVLCQAEGVEAQTEKGLSMQGTPDLAVDDRRHPHKQPRLSDGSEDEFCRIGPLENTANNFSPYGENSLVKGGKQGSLKRGSERVILEARERRKNRMNARYWLWQFSGLDRVKGCGRRRATSSSGVIVRMDKLTNIAGYAGLQSCASVWADPVCNARIMARRAVDLGYAIEKWQATGGRVLFATLTMRHNRDEELGQLWGRLSKGWHRVTGGKAWKTDCRVYGITGWTRVVEVTYGRNGWHVHTHVLVFVEGEFTAARGDELMERLFGRWKAGVVASGGREPLRRGQDVRVIKGAGDKTLAAYFTKAVYGANVALEFTQSQTKKQRTLYGTRPVWAVLDEAQQGVAWAVDAWREWERASKGKRQMSWSKGLRDLLGMEVEESDEGIVSEEMGSSDDDVVIITAEGWQTVTKGKLCSQVLDAVESRGLAGLHQFLDDNGIEYMEV